jgi:hypothetical protein
MENINVVNKDSVFKEMQQIGTHPDLKVDIDGEIKLAIENYNTWGGCYLPSLWSCYANEYNGNFRDKGTKRFENGTIFKSILERLSETFKLMKPQRPSVVRYNKPAASGYFGSMKSTSVTSMADQFMSLSMGCFTGESTVMLEDGTMMPVNKLVVGQKLFNDNVVENIVLGPKADKFNVVDNNLALTDWHPFKRTVDNEWKFPNDVYGDDNTNILSDKYTWNLVTKTGVVIMGTDNTEVITLGHGLTDGILDHPYLGSQQVKIDIAKHFDKEGGVCRILGFTRDTKEPYLINGVK